VAEVYAGTSPLELWCYESGSRVVSPYLLSGERPAVGGAVVPEGTAQGLGLLVGSGLSLFVPGDKVTARDLTVSAVSRDPLWPMLLAPVEGLAPGHLRLLVRLAVGIPVDEWVRWLAKEVDCEGVPLEDLWLSGAGAGAGAASSPADQPGDPEGGLAGQLQRGLSGLIVLVAALGVANGVALSMVERGSQVALLRALGVRAGGIIVMYVGEAAFLVGAGVAVAVAIAFGATALAPAEVGAILPVCVLRGSLTAAGVSLAASLFVAAGWHALPPAALLGRRAE